LSFDLQSEAGHHHWRSQSLSEANMDWDNAVQMSVVLAIVLVVLWTSWRVTRWLSRQDPKTSSWLYAVSFSAVSAAVALVSVLLFGQYGGKSEQVSLDSSGSIEMPSTSPTPSVTAPVRPEPPVMAKIIITKPAPAPATQAPQTQAQTEEQTITSLPKGSAVLEAVQNQVQYETSTVTLSVSNQSLLKLNELIRRQSPGAATAGASGVRLSHYMRAELVADKDDFEIAPKSVEALTRYVTFDPGDVAEWHWDVTPLSWGKHKPLIAHLYTLQSPDSKYAWKEIEVKNLSVEVSVSPLGMIRRYFKEIATVLVLPVLGWLIPQLWAMRKKKSPDADALQQPTPLPHIEGEDKKAA